MTLATAPSQATAPAPQARGSAKAAALPETVTDTVARLQRELENRGRSDVARRLDARLAGVKVDSLPVEVRLDLAALLMLIRGRAAAEAVVRPALIELGVPARGVQNPQLLAGRSRALVQRTARGLAIMGRARDAMDLTLQCCATPEPCDPESVATVLARMSYHDEALAVYERCPPRGALIEHALRHVAYLDLAGRYGTALAVLAPFADARDPQPRVLDRRRAMLHRLGRWTESIQQLDDLWRAHPDQPAILALYNRAFRDFQGAATARGGPADAYAAFEKQLRARAKTDPRDAPARFAAAMLLLDDARYARVQIELAAVAPLAPKDARPLAIKAMVMLWTGDLAAADKLVAQASAVDKWDCAVPYARSLIARERGDLATAARELQHFLTLRRDSRAIRYRVSHARALADLNALNRGVMPEPVDRPDHPSRRYHPHSLFEPFELPPPGPLLGAAFAVLIAAMVGFWLAWRR